MMQNEFRISYWTTCDHKIYYLIVNHLHFCISKNIFILFDFILFFVLFVLFYFDTI